LGFFLGGGGERLPNNNKMSSGMGSVYDQKQKENVPI